MISDKARWKAPRPFRQVLSEIRAIKKHKETVKMGGSGGLDDGLTC